jgi:hypothetical protein
VRDGLTLNIDYIVDHAHGEMERVKTNKVQVIIHTHSYIENIDISTKIKNVVTSIFASLKWKRGTCF